MVTTRLSSKGQVIIPKGVRTSHHWHSGLELQVIDSGDGILLKPRSPFKRTTLDQVAGMLKREGQKALSLAEMDEAIGREIGENGVIALDTNVLVRLIVRDEEAQFKAAQALMARHEIYLPDSVILETAWVLRSGYGLSAKDICAAFRDVFGLENVVLDDPHKIDKVLEWHESGLDFADALHLAKSAHLPELKTFDKGFIKGAKGLSECKVSGL